MPTKEEMDKVVEEMKLKFYREKMSEKLSDFTKVVLFRFTDLDVCYILVFENGSLEEVSERCEDTAEIKIITTSKVFIAILRKEFSPMAVFMGGMLEVKGSFSDLSKLLKLI